MEHGLGHDTYVTVLRFFFLEHLRSLSSAFLTFLAAFDTLDSSLLL